LSQAINCSVFHSLMIVQLSDICFGIHVSSSFAKERGQPLGLRIMVVVSDELIN
jgi:hypothetical protein